MQYRVKIKGNQPLLLHKYTVATVSEVPTRKTFGLSYTDEWVKGTYGNEAGEVVIPAANIKASIYDGSKGQKKGKVALSRIVNSTLIISPFEPPIKCKIDGKLKEITLEDIKANDWIYVCGAVVTGRRVDRSRTQLPIGWELEFEVMTKNDDLTKEDIKALLVSAGESAGIGDWRPSAPKKPGIFGTFNVVTFE